MYLTEVSSPQTLHRTHRNHLTILPDAKMPLIFCQLAIAVVYVWLGMVMTTFRMLLYSIRIPTWARLLNRAIESFEDVCPSC